MYFIYGMLIPITCKYTLFKENENVRAPLMTCKGTFTLSVYICEQVWPIVSTD